ncbi:putative RING finger protein [Cladophialophora carrionii]|uniref:Putative RING finger protein n=1 Tax=Cladophialophora carrionii TaxID=86049 RepID=A0A1C1CGQ5_9EURO|nr:putative RING finger protein [Cladophialophora carrionii]
MKFGQDFESTLARGEYPPEWVNSAISYKKLKKCIKRVQQELLSLGLDKDTLDALWKRVGSPDLGADLGAADSLLQYTVDDGETVSFTPKLTIVIDPRDGSPMDAWLSPETRQILRRLARSSRAHIDHTLQRDDSPDEQRRFTGESPSENDKHQLELVEVPLTADSEFFQTLRHELACLDDLQKAEYARLQDETNRLGSELRALRASKSKRSKKEVEIWRKIFELYSDAEVFLSSHEADAGARDAAHAQKQLQAFTQSLSTQQKQAPFRLGDNANTALSRFLQINVNLLRLIKFQEINRTAINKIMKKFDKRTSLPAKSSVTQSLTKSSPFIVQDLAKATCFTISEEVLSVIPQLNDYLCPICFSVSWRPVRLRCGHLFCIRCMIVMQQEENDQCPLCREAVVLEATEKNIDPEMVKFLYANFKADVKEKQRQNEIAAGIDRWGAAYEHAQRDRCVVM